MQASVKRGALGQDVWTNGGRTLMQHSRNIMCFVMCNGRYSMCCGNGVGHSVMAGHTVCASIGTTNSYVMMNDTNHL